MLEVTRFGHFKAGFFINCLTLTNIQLSNHPQPGRLAGNLHPIALHVACLIGLLWGLPLLSFQGAVQAAEAAKTFQNPEDKLYQYFIPEDPANPQDEAKSFGTFLWLPPDCKRVNGLFIAPKNMNEIPLFEFSELRDLCRELGLGIAVIACSPRSPFQKSNIPGFESQKGPKVLDYKAGGAEALQGILDRLAEHSGYAEIKDAPLIPVGHSYAGSWPSHVAYWNPQRTICAIPLKTILHPGPPSDPEAKPSNRLNGAPALLVDEQCGPNLTSDYWLWKKQGGIAARQSEGNPLGNPVSRLTALGTGHCTMPKPMMALIVKYVREACHRRLVDSPVPDGPTPLKSIDIRDGWLVDENQEKPAAECHPTAKYSDYKGNRDTAIWYFNEALARECEAFFRSAHEGRQPQCVAFIDPDTRKPAKHLASDWTKMAGHPVLAEDQTFTLTAVNLEEPYAPDFYNPGVKLGRSSSPMVYSASCEQVGENKFRLSASRFNPELLPGGVNVEGDNFGGTNCQPSMVLSEIAFPLPIAGPRQKLVFPKIEDVPIGTTKVPLGASADSGLPVSYFVIYGPAVVEGDALRITPIPTRSKLPIKVKVGAYQWGRHGENPVRTTSILNQSFSIQSK